MSFDEEIKLKVTADTNPAIDSVDKLDKKVKQTESSAKNLASALLSAFASAGAASFFKNTIDQANKLEASINRVESAARAFGQSTIKARAAAQDLAEDGFLSLNQSASALSNLMATGLNVDQSKKFITAAKDISAFGNTIDNAGESITSGIKGILTGSSELVENMSPAMKTLSMRFTEQKNSLGPVIATQNLYNGVLKLGNQFAGDAAKYLQTTAAAQQALAASADKASAAIGKSLQPALVAVLSVAKGIVDLFTSWFTSLDKGTASILAVGGVIVTVLIPALFGMGKALTALGLTASSAWTVILGPIALVVAAVAAVTAALYQLEARGRSSNIAEKYLKEKQAAQGAAEKLTELSKLTKLNADQEKELALIKADLSKRAEAMGKSYDAQGKSVKQLLADQEKLRNQEREFAADKVRANLKRNEAALADAESMGGIRDFAGKFTIGNLSKENALKISSQQIASDKQALLDIYQPVQDLTKKQEAAVMKSDAKVARFIESENQLKEIEKNRLFTIASIKKGLDKEERDRQQSNANKDALYQREQIKNQQKQILAEFIEDKREADMVDLRESTTQAKRASQELLSYELKQAMGNNDLIAKAKERQAKRQADIDATDARKQAQIEAQAVADTLAAAQSATAGFSQAAKAKDVGGFLGGLGGMSTGLSKISPELEALGPLGSAMGAIGGITSTIAGLFGKSDEERAREAAEAQRVREEQLKILELQASYQKSMLALQEAAAKLPFENLQRQLRLIDIESQQAALQGGDANAIENTRLSRRQAAIQQTLTSQSGAIAGGQLFGGVGSSPEQLIGFLSERGAESLAVQQFASLFGSLSSDVINRATGDAQIAQLASYRGKVPPALMAVFDDYVSKRNALLAEIDAERKRLRPIEVQLGTDWLNTQLSNAGNPRLANILSGSLSGVNALGSEISADTGIAENLLSTLEQSLSNEKAIKDNTKKTADNTTLQLEKQRENMFIDIAGGGLRGFGQFLSTGAQVNTGALSLSASTSSAIAATAALKSWDERNHEELEKIVTINKFQAAVLLKIAENTQNLSTTGSLSQLVSMLNDINTRT